MTPDQQRQASMDEALRDKARLDWLDRDALALPEGSRIWFDYNGPIRAAIDAAMSAEAAADAAQDR